jgi:hypothetical protein
MMKIKKGDEVKIKCQGLQVKGEVISADNWGVDGGWYIEMLDSNGQYRYWKQGEDGGELLEHAVSVDMGKFESLNFIIDHEELDFIGYEFEGEEIFIDEIGCEQSLFRMDVDKKTGESSVHSAYSQDFDVMEDVTMHFDIEQLFEDINKYIKENEVDNQGDVYVKYVNLIKEGYECDDATIKAYC